MAYKVLGKLVGNTGDANQLTMVVKDSFSVRRGEFVRIMHQERKDEGEVAVLGRVMKISRTNMLYNAGFGDGVTELELLPGANVTGENMLLRLNWLAIAALYLVRSRSRAARLTQAPLLKPSTFSF